MHTCVQAAHTTGMTLPSAQPIAEVSLVPRRFLSSPYLQVWCERCSTEVGAFGDDSYGRESARVAARRHNRTCHGVYPGVVASGSATLTVHIPIDADRADVAARDGGLDVRAIMRAPGRGDRGRGVVWDGTEEQAKVIVRWLGVYGTQARYRVDECGRPAILIPDVGPDAEGIANLYEGQAVVVTDERAIEKFYPATYGDETGFITAPLVLHGQSKPGVPVTGERELPCDRDCLTEGSPMEDCSLHGRDPRELWDIVNDLIEDRARMAEQLRRVEDLATAWEDRGRHMADYAESVPDDVADSIRDAGQDFLHRAQLVRHAVAGDTPTTEGGDS